VCERERENKNQEQWEWTRKRKGSRIGLRAGGGVDQKFFDRTRKNDTRSATTQMKSPENGVSDREEIIKVENSVGL
jgi:hypothetical protein